MMRAWIRVLLSLVAALVVAGPMATSAGAADTRTGNSVSVDSDEVTVPVICTSSVILCASRER